MCSIFVEMKWLNTTLHFPPCLNPTIFYEMQRNLREPLVYFISLQIRKPRFIKVFLFVSGDTKTRIWSLNSPFSVLYTWLALNFSLCNWELSLTQNSGALLINHLPLQLCLSCYCLSSTSFEIFRIHLIFLLYCNFPPVHLPVPLALTPNVTE